MEIRQFAESILFGKTLQEKLISVSGGWSDESPGVLSNIPESPARALKFEPIYRRRGKFEFPKVSSFADPLQRAKALHYFANHELEAMELMALALLRFTDVPKTFRVALAGIITEEQKHLKLYMARMKELGIEFGDFPLSGFFWKALSLADDPKKFTAAMSLTLEQANLDHCIFFEEVFSGVGDEKSAQIMREVLADEVGHVRHGVNWFHRWREEKKSLWRDYADSLPSTINPARARGKNFSVRVREEAGFDLDFIQNLEVFAHSKGRVPDLYYFYPFVEYELALGPHGINIPQKMYSLKTDLEILPAYIAKTDDMVLVEKIPRTEFLQEVKAVGLDLAQFVCLGEELKKQDRRVREFRPWGWCYHTLNLSRKVSEYVDLNLKNENKISYYNDLYAKTLSLGILAESEFCDRDIVGSVCTTEREVAEKISSQSVIKAVLGSSGQNQIQVKDKLDEKQELWLRRLLKEQGKVVVEPWLDRVFDFSMQIEVRPDGSVKNKGFARFISDEAGKYRGAWLGGFETNLGKEEIIFLKDQDRLKNLTQNVIVRVGKELHRRNYAGAAGIDCFVYRTSAGELKIKPLVEINVRNNMGEIAIQLSRRLVSRSVGLWMIMGLHELKNFGFTNFTDFARDLKSKFPVEQKSNLIESGAVFTTDPTTANRYVSFMVVSKNIDAIKAHFSFLDFDADRA